MTKKPERKSDEERLLDFCVPGENGCLEWNGPVRQSSRTPLLKIDNDQVYPRQVLYNIRFPQMPTKRTYGNICNNPICIEPLHTITKKPSMSAHEKLSRHQKYGPSNCHFPLNHNGENEYHDVHHEGKTKGWHRLSVECYRGEIPKDHEVDHLCFNKPCSKLEHLEVVTKEEHRRRTKENGLYTGPKTKGAMHGNTHLPDPDVIWVRELFRQKLSISKIAREYDISVSHVRHIGNFMARRDANLIYYEINNGRTMAPFELLFFGKKEKEHFMVIEGHNGCTFYARTASDSSWWSADYPAYPYLKKILGLQAA